MKYLIIFLLSIPLFAFSQSDKLKVLAIYPTTDSIPVNILRFYIQFSKPMQEMDILKHIHLVNSQGEDMTGVFYENQYELWNENRTMVTLIIDPGRVKTGLLANQSMGRAFEETQQYELKVDSLLMDFDNHYLEAIFSKKFVAIAEDKKPPNIKMWQYSVPTKNTNDALNIDFKDCIDNISATTYIKIIMDKKEIEGTITLDKNETNWSFKPLMSWQKGNYEIWVHPALEDIAANSINQIFDHKVSDFKNEKLTQKIKIEIK